PRSARREQPRRGASRFPAGRCSAEFFPGFSRVSLMAAHASVTGTELLPPYLREHVSAATRYFVLPEPLLLECGRLLERVTVAYRTWGDPRNAANNAILI